MRIGVQKVPIRSLQEGFAPAWRLSVLILDGGPTTKLSIYELVISFI